MEDSKTAVEKTKSTSMPARKGFDRAASILLDAILFISVLSFTAVAVIALALAAPLALGVTAIAGAFSRSKSQVRQQGRTGWRVARAS